MSQWVLGRFAYEVAEPAPSGNKNNAVGLIHGRPRSVMDVARRDFIDGFESLDVFLIGGVAYTVVVFDCPIPPFEANESGRSLQGLVLSPYCLPVCRLLVHKRLVCRLMV